MKFSEMKFENLNCGCKETPTTEIPKEIVEYYMSHEYANAGIALSADTCKEVAKILDKEEL